MARISVNHRGLSLVEIIVSLVLVSLLAAGIFSAISYSKRASIRAQEKMIIIALAEKKMNELKSGGVPALPQGTVSECINGTAPGCRAVQGVPVGSLETVVHDTDDTNLKEVKVTFSWTDRLGALRTESIVTAMYQE